MRIEQRLRDLGIALPAPIRPLGSYTTSLRSGNLLLLSGHIPLRDGAVVYAGKVGSDLTLEQGQEAARFTALTCLATIAAAQGLDSVRRILRLVGYVASAPGFVQQPAVLNAASNLLVEVFGEDGVHVRTAVGVAELPGNAAVELELTIEVE